MADYVYELLAKIGLDDREYQEKLTGAGQSMKNTGSEIATRATQMKSHMLTLTGAAAAGVGAFAVSSVKTAAEFDTSMSKVAAISGATGKDLEALRDKAKEMGETTRFSAAESADALTYMAMAGWKPNQMLDGLAGIMNLAAASGEDLASTSDIVTDALTAFGMKAEDSGRFADILAAASSNANTNVSMLGESFKYAAPVAGALGISAEDTSIALGLMANSGIKAGMAGTALRTGLTNLAKPTDQMKKYMDQYNISMKQNADGSINLRDTMIDLREKLGGLSESEQAAAVAAIFGKEAMSGWMAIINASQEDLDKLTNAIDNSSGAAENMAHIMEDNLEGDIRKLKSAWEGFRIEIGEKLMPVARQVIQWLTSLIQHADEIIPKVAAAAAAFGTFAIAINITSIIKKVTLAIQAFFALLVANPIALLIAAIVGLITYLVTLYKTNEEFREKVDAVWAKVKEIISGVIERIKLDFEILKAALGLLADWFREKLDNIKESWKTFKENIRAAVDGVKEAFSSLKEKFSEIKTALAEKAKELAETIKSKWDDIKNNTKTKWDEIKNAIKEKWDGITSTVKSKIDELKNAASEKFQNIKTVIVEKTAAIAEALKTKWDDIKNTIKEKWNGITETVKSTVNGMKTAIVESFQNIKAAITEKTSAIADTLKTKFDSIKNAMKEKWGSLKEVASNTWQGIKERFTNGFETIHSLTVGKLESLVEKFRAKFDKAKEVVQRAVERFKSLMNFNWSLPKLKLPHIRISGHFSIKPPSAPKFSVEWYKKAYETPFLFSQPTVLQGFGDGPGSEIVYGHQNLMSDIENSVVRAFSSFMSGLTAQGGGNGQPVTVILELDRMQMGKATFQLYNEAEQKFGVKLAKGVI